MAPPKELVAAWHGMVRDGDPLAALRAAQALKDELGAWEGQLAREALAGGETWETIGAALGISRQAAWERLRGRIAAAIEEDTVRLRAKRIRMREERRTQWESQKTSGGPKAAKAKPAKS